MKLEQYEKLKRKLEQKKTDADKAAGKAEQLMDELRKKYHVTTIKGARKLLAHLQRTEKTAEKKLEQAITKYEELAKR